MNVLIWILAILSLAYFICQYFIPFIMTKYIFWVMSRKIKKMANRHSGELKNKLLDISNQMQSVSKEEKL